MSTESPAVYLRLHENDNVVIALKVFETGEVVDALGLKFKIPIPFGQKIAVEEIAESQTVRRYGQEINDKFDR